MLYRSTHTHQPSFSPGKLEQEAAVNQPLQVGVQLKVKHLLQVEASTSDAWIAAIKEIIKYSEHSFACARV